MTAKEIIDAAMADPRTREPIPKKILDAVCKQVNEMPLQFHPKCFRFSWGGPGEPSMTVCDTFPAPPSRHRGIDPAGHPVYVTATKAEIESGEQTAFCQECGAYVLPKWDVPETTTLDGHVVPVSYTAWVAS